MISLLKVSINFACYSDIIPRPVVEKYLAYVPYRQKTDDVIDALCLTVTGAGEWAVYHT
ncbi:hypothetical protein [Dehalobacter sp. TBBPA1]|uniref:hypothetical protein n=1 Tax=Dehalobacter sp. TBBPA1 TaxID=3235037 RepID=UPI0034A4B112